jgi:endonuclease/exonuclease/phosphatase family metal-dependent hydrolase
MATQDFRPRDEQVTAADVLPEGAPPVHSLHILTVNTHKGFSPLNRRFVLPELREAVRATSADVVFLQEVLGVHRRHGERYDNWSDVPQYEFLADSIWPVFAYGRNAVYPDGDHGNALLSKFPILHHKNHDVTVAGQEERGLLHSILAVPGQPPVHTVCVHLGLREGQRHKQLKLLCELLEGLPATEPVIVAGDFNDWRLQADKLLAGCGLREAFVEAQGAPARSFPARLPLLRLDRIYLRNARAKAPLALSRKPWSHLSDHVPLAVEVCL